MWIKRLGVSLAAAAALLLAINLALHFGQIQHDRLDY
jgi:hypothetical protein